MTTDSDTGPPWPDHPEYRPKNITGEWNPDEWTPDPSDRFDAGEVNLDVSSTVGPDYLGQQTTNVRGHRYDRDPDMDRPHARRLALRGEFDDLADDAPLPLLDSDMRTGPIEGTQGRYKRVCRIDGCPECGSDYGVEAVETMAGLAFVTCLLCDHEIN